MFTDWAQTLPPRPLPRTVTPLAGEYHLGYVGRLADANHLEFAGGRRRPARPGRVHHPRPLRLATARKGAAGCRWRPSRWPGSAGSAGPTPTTYLRDIEGFHQTLRPACRRCTARYGITAPVPCQLPPHQAVCRRHRLWTGPSARSHDSQLDVSPFPEILRAQRRHLTLTSQYHWKHVDTAAGEATRALYQAIRDGTWISGQRERMRQLAPGSWQQALTRALSRHPGPTHDIPCHPAIEIALYPDVIWLTARILQARSTSHRSTR